MSPTVDAKRTLAPGLGPGLAPVAQWGRFGPGLTFASRLSDIQRELLCV